MQEHNENKDLYCGNFEGAISALEQAFEWLKKPANWDKPYSTRFDKEHIYGSRKRELFAVLSLVQKLKKKILHKIEKDKDEIECTALTRIDAECILKRTERLILSRDELIGLYRKATMPKKPDSITEINRQFKTPEERLQQALDLVDDMSPLFLMQSIFSEVESMRTEIFIHLHPDKIEKCFAAQLLEKEKERVRVSTYPRERLAMTNTFMDKHMPEEAKVTELSLENYISINQDMYDSHQQSLLNNRRYGEQYKTSFRFEWDITDFLAELYHTDGSSEILKHIAMMEVCTGEIRDLYNEIQLREYDNGINKEGNEIKIDLKEENGNEGTCKTSTDVFLAKLSTAYEMCKAQDDIGIAVLLSTLCVHGDLEKGKQWLKGYNMNSIPDFTYWLKMHVDAYDPDSNKLTVTHKALNTFIKTDDKEIDYFTLYDSTSQESLSARKKRLESFIICHYNNPHDKRAIASAELATSVFDILEGTQK